MNIITEVMYDIEIPISIEKDLETYEYHSFARGYHAYMNIWKPLIGEVLTCTREPSNEVDKNAVAIIREDSWGKRSIVGHIPENFSRFSSMFLTIPNSRIEVQVIGKRVNRGGGYGLEIPVIYRFVGPHKLVKWMEAKVSALKNELADQIAKCLK